MSDLLTAPPGYFVSRMAELGIDPLSKDWSIELYNPDAEFPIPDTALLPIFTPDDKDNIRIRVYDIEQNIINYFAAGEGKMSHINGKDKPYYVTRLKEPYIDKNGKPVKYLMPKGQGTYPFFPPNICAAYKAKEKITTLVLTEGFFKAAKASMHGMYIIGLSSITHMKDKGGELHNDIKKVILNNQVENVIWLVDGDCLNLTSKMVDEYEDLYKRPSQFFNSGNVFKDLMSKFDVKKFFAHVQSDAFPPIIETDKPNQFPKGLDDALCSVPGAEGLVIDDLLNISKPPLYFFRLDITYSSGKLHKYFNLGDVTSFYLHYVDRYPVLKGKEFKWNGTRYKYNDEKNTCEVIIPAEASNYFRVGDQYYTWVYVPNKYSQLERRYESRQKSTIGDDHGKNIFKFIAKYQAFCNVPDHNNFQAVIHSCFNVYAQFEHEPEAGEFPETTNFIKHIFGCSNIKYKDPKTGEKIDINEYDLGLDYITLLYKQPTQILPILCLVSHENNTGKTTFAEWLKMIFTQNAAIIGNAELVDPFNASWASKLIIVCDETKIDKQEVIEKVKRLSTANKIFMNKKGKDHYELDFFGKFIFLSNNEENFIYASNDDVRYWIRKIPVIKNLNINLKQDLLNEIPAFLHFLDQRKFAAQNVHRGYFDPELIKTDALKKVIENSSPTIEKEIRSMVRDMFFDFGVQVIYMSPKDIKDDWFKNRNFEKSYIEKVLTERMKLHPYHEYEYRGVCYLSIDEIKLKYPELAELDPDLNPDIKPKYKTKRYQIPGWGMVPEADGKMVQKRVNISRNGRPLVFKIESFLTAKEIESIDADAETKYNNNIMNDSVQVIMDLPVNNEDDTNPKPDLPF